VLYGAVQALFGVNIDVYRGEVVSILGGNASGKSTTLKSVLGIVRPARGEIFLNGEPVCGMEPAEVIKRQVASVPEGRRVFPEMSVHENLLMGAYPRRADKAGVSADLQEVYTAFPQLAGRRRQAAGSLSGGEQQMLALGRAWMRRAELLCIDEPSMGLSPKFVDMVYTILFNWKNQGKTILLVEQNAPLALELADRAYILQHGRIVLQGQAEELAGDPEIKKAYLGTAV
jgi:branched-chain amino acid transport system ATP-binding protein